MNRNEKAELFNDLHMGKCEVLFQKVNGERRKMICTLAPKALVEKFGTKYKDAKHAWRFVFDIEYGAHSVDLLEKDFTLVPFIDKLKEDCEFKVPVFDTQNKATKNIVFKEIDKY